MSWSWECKWGWVWVCIYFLTISFSWALIKSVIVSFLRGWFKRGVDEKLKSDRENWHATLKSKKEWFFLIFWKFRQIIKVFVALENVTTKIKNKAPDIIKKWHHDIKKRQLDHQKSLKPSLSIRYHSNQLSLLRISNFDPLKYIYPLLKITTKPL